MVLVHDRGRKSGREYGSPMMYLPDEIDDNLICVFATKAGAPSNPDWYYNLIAVGKGSIERGTDSYPVTVRELTGDERDSVYAEQAQRYRLRRLRETHQRHPHYPRPRTPPVIVETLTPPRRRAAHSPAPSRYTQRAIGRVSSRRRRASRNPGHP